MEDINELAAALAKAQGEIEPAPKDADNPFFKSKYASLAAVREVMRHPFANNGLSVVQIPEVKPGTEQVHLRTLLLHSSGQSLECGTLSADVDLANPQKIGSVLSYFRRYAISAVAGVVADEDDDGNAASAPTKSTVAKKDQKWVADALKSIAECTTQEELDNIGEQIKGKPTAVCAALRKPYAAKLQQLTSQEEG